MTTERRTDARGKNASRVTFTDAASDTPSEGTLHDIGRGGMFVATASKLAVGKRIDFEVHIATGGNVSGMARVVWIREAAVGDLPAGLGIKFIDVDNDALLAIDRIVGLKKNVRERTVFGMAAPAPAPNAEAPPKVEAPAKIETKAESPVAAPVADKPKPKVRERTMLGVAPPPAQREKELSWPDEPPEPPPEPEPEVAKPEPEQPKPEAKPAPDPEPVAKPAPKDEPPAKLEVVEVAQAKEPEPPLVPRELPKREAKGGRGWMVALLVVVVVGVTAFAVRDHIAAVFSPTPVPTTSVAPSASASTSASATASASETASVAPITSASNVPSVEADAAPEEAADASVAAMSGDGGSRDAGKHDAGHHHDAGGPHAHAHPVATTHPGNDNPY